MSTLEKCGLRVEEVMLGYEGGWWGKSGGRNLVASGSGKKELGCDQK